MVSTMPVYATLQWLSPCVASIKLAVGFVERGWYSARQVNAFMKKVDSVQHSTLRSRISSIVPLYAILLIWIQYIDKRVSHPFLDLIVAGDEKVLEGVSRACRVVL